ncbi:unnamed protein product [Vitrella brassicaformis CCMP3155]|uniref:F-box domain-containing protein n=2 Tax=Vitrella brassicaformis TaxID=1169539 RepID=A0A0G4EJ12_VITBC|nr:unnamed protein product [Vitrella brassicaformis CCMP3155]|eukprot:CEL96691.1 unnamed protein product [Vitrella brassicaformis CCMP3155]
MCACDLCVKRQTESVTATPAERQTSCTVVLNAKTVSRRHYSPRSQSAGKRTMNGISDALLERVASHLVPRALASLSMASRRCARVRRTDLWREHFDGEARRWDLSAQVEGSEGEAVIFCLDGASVFHVLKVLSLERHLAALRLGDVVCFGNYRDSGAAIVTEDFTLIENPDHGGEGFLTVPLRVTRLFPDPLAKYRHIRVCTMEFAPSSPALCALLRAPSPLPSADSFAALRAVEYHLVWSMEADKQVEDGGPTQAAAGVGAVLRGAPDLVLEVRLVDDSVVQKRFVIEAGVVDAVREWLGALTE